MRITLRFDIEQAYHFRPLNELYKEVLADTTYRNPVHPVRYYFRSLVWDGKPRIDTWLIDYGQVKPRDEDQLRYIRSIGAKVLIAAVRRVQDPGCKFDEMLILESKQGLNKSSAIQALCPDPDWFSDSLPLGADAQKVVEQTGGKWIIKPASYTDTAAKKSRPSKHSCRVPLTARSGSPTRTSRPIASGSSF